MTWVEVLVVATVFLALGVAIGIGVGWYLYHPLNNLSIEDLRQELDRRLQFEELEASERKIHAEMRYGTRNSVPRPNAGAPARISHIEVRKDR